MLGINRKKTHFINFAENFTITSTYQFVNVCNFLSTRNAYSFVIFLCSELMLLLTQNETVMDITFIKPKYQDEILKYENFIA